ncbi:CBU_0592 family membrane protein [Curtobacterium sp. SL109]|uniref:CBU_0592 family membrane protein n=1 Tax=Curtobacterium sp. SL109 TaxID=2994662 RepID=UPI002273C729|nr:hypothetical protein [Curtobacterium sp. SL109]MCY1693326.1 hypothetical protein [Curtobacterium sp. SL109]
MEFLGWFGAITVLSGYILFSTGKLPNGPVYQLFNLVGGVAVAVNVAAHHAVPSTIVNGIWAIVAVVVLVRMGRARRAARRSGLQPHRELTTEPPATTAVLPVIGPAVRDHESGVTADEQVPQSLQTGTGTGTGTATATATGTGTATATAAATPAATTPARPAAPMTESIPVITATIALALVSAAQQQQQEPAQDGLARTEPHTT